MAEYTPMMQQYLDIKEKNKDSLLFFRLGDFYEMFFDDAVIASKELEITLTGKDCGQKERAPMCGVPFHSAEGYIAKLISKGYKVAICEQVEDPKKAKTLVKRDVVRIITPGTVMDNNVLEEGKNNYILSVYDNVKGYGLSFCDVSTGEFFTTQIEDKNYLKVIDEIGKYTPSEIITNEKTKLCEEILNIFNIKAEVYNNWAFGYENANLTLLKHFKVKSLKGYGIDNLSLSICASGALMDYLLQTQKNDLSNITSIKRYETNSYLVMDLSTRRNLELTQTISQGSKKGSLLWVIDKTVTSMGARLLRKWLEMPLIDTKIINKRLDCVQVFKKEVIYREEIKELLNTVLDIERLISRVVFKTANARDLISLKNSFKNMPFIKTLIGNLDCEYMTEVYNDFDTLEDITALIEGVITEDAPFSVREGNMIKEGFNEELDKYRNAKKDGSLWLKDLEEKERNLTGIKGLKVKYNKVFGYYIEVTNSYLSLVPDRYIRKQTLSNCERFITEDLKKIEDTILGADEKIVQLEYEIFSVIRDKVASLVDRIQKTANYTALIDVFNSLGEVADKNNYSKPVVDNEDEIIIKAGRHPVVEKTRKDNFIPNDTYLNLSHSRLSIITGPNMAGKSTYMRQSALIILLAQIGSFVPAEYSKIGVCDKIFTRVGASDDLATGLSTFMIEMSEVANILNNASNRSLLILDEIGRGTSTYDGLSIAWSVVEYISNKIGARTLFATHYHELTDLEDKIEGVKNYRVMVEEKGKEVIFLRKIERGGADHSYGIYVAQLAGVPLSVLNRARNILKYLEENEKDKDTDIFNAPDTYDESADILESIRNEIDKIDINTITPFEALGILNTLKGKLK